MNSAKILVVEDDSFLREVYVDTLKQEGYNVDSAIDGTAAFQKMQEGGWDLVLLDIILPDINGVEVLHKVLAMGKPNLFKKVVFLTNLDSDSTLKEALQIGNGYLIKSQITPGDLLLEVKLYLTKV